ncbi:MAG TPA: 3-oxoacyl-[acyl-carrier-protein] synthase III C-terminal domain-containing protein [Candidatus Dormibacteraeota bacterium]|nr:3-oxoacyl-[acyl-carrier-protein] synthase III C-terminal domain-containing protein [Candidatus Dormibacteraeota bacterium]
MDRRAGQAQIVGVVTAVPTIRVTMKDVALAVGRLRGRGLHWPAPSLAGMRYFAQPLPSIMAPRSVSAQTDAYLEHARILARQVSCDALDRSGISRDTVGLVIGVSCTGFVLPSLDAELIPILGLRPDVARLPITELGCGGGIAGLARAADYLRAYPDRAVLLFSVELPSLTFQPDDHSVDNLVAAMVFGDGAGAAVLRTGASPNQWTVERTGTLLVPEGARHLGYELRDGGLRVVLSRDLPALVEARLGEAVDAFLAPSGLCRCDIDIMAAHPGGPRIFEAVERALGLEADALRISRAVFAGYGNASSAGIFFVLSALEPASRTSRALAIAFGPGLSIELALLRFGA